MLRVTFDLFSGLRDPALLVIDEAEVRAVLGELDDNRSMVTDGPPPDAGLGFRGVAIEPLDDATAQDLELPARVYVPVGSGATGRAGSALAERLIGLIGRANIVDLAAPDSLPLDEPLQDTLIQQLRSAGSSEVTVADSPEVVEDEAAGAMEAAAAACTIERAAYNPGFWNNDVTTRQNNNCYNYASNKRTNTFAQPGRGCGQMYRSIDCAEVSRAAMCDGLNRRYTCFPTGEKPRYLVALVVAPGPGFRDYHWYRWLKEGFWGHKPGSTAARNVDNSGRVITNPQTCDRGPYTHFCGYFYTRRTQRIN